MYILLRWGKHSSNLGFLFQGKAKKVVPAQTLWFDILKAQIETGTPYMLYKVHLMPYKFEYLASGPAVLCPTIFHC
jgi:hypothetical protein